MATDKRPDRPLFEAGENSDKVPRRHARPKDVTQLVREHGIQIVDLKFTDLPGLWQHFSIGLPELTTSCSTRASVRRLVDTRLPGDPRIRHAAAAGPSTAFIDPMCEVPTLSLICNVIDPILKKPYSRDPRHVARKAEQHLRGTGVAQTCYFGPELEFFIFDSIRFEQNEHCGYYYVDSAEGAWNSGRDEGAYGGGNLGFKPRFKEGYFRCHRTTRCRTSAPRSCSA
jgi:glutamine synthetase